MEEGDGGGRGRRVFRRLSPQDRPLDNLNRDSRPEFRLRSEEKRHRADRMQDSSITTWRWILEDGGGGRLTEPSGISIDSPSPRWPSQSGGAIKAETNPKVFAFGPVVHQIQQEAPSRRWDSCDIMYLSHVELCLARGLPLHQPHPS
jgi:hypothetical protein